MNQYYLQQIFSTIFYISNKLQAKGDELDERLTVRQWMTLLAIMHLPEDNASYNQIATMLGCSKQNAKKLVSVLQRKGMVVIEKSKLDSRAVNVKIVDNCREYLKEYYEKGNEQLNQMFEYFEEEELKTLWKLLKKLAAFDGNEWSGFDEKVPIEKRGEGEHERK